MSDIQVTICPQRTEAVLLKFHSGNQGISFVMIAICCVLLLFYIPLSDAKTVSGTFEPVTAAGSSGQYIGKFCFSGKFIVI